MSWPRALCVLAAISVGCVAPSAVEPADPVDAAEEAPRDAGAIDQPTYDQAAPDRAAPAPAAGADAALRTSTDGPAMVVPVVWIEVAGQTIRAETKITGRLRIIEQHDGTLADPQALSRLPATLETPIGIEVRGNSSAQWPKKSFGVELRDDAGMARGRPVLGMPSEADWVLYSCYSDKTCLRNALAYALARETSRRYSVRAQYAEVFLDGKYNGLYMVVEKIKPDRNRVLLPAPIPEATPAGNDITGGYIFRRDGPPKTPAARNWTSKAGSLYNFGFPKFDRLTAAQRAYLVGYVDELEAMWKSPEWADPTKGYRSWIDVPSWVDWAILQEFSKSLDAYSRSVYLVKEPRSSGGRLIAGPSWDFDLAWGLGGRAGSEKPEGFMHVINLALTGNNKILFYWGKIWSDPAFQRDVKCRWQELRKGPLTYERMNEKLVAWREYIRAAERRDHERWPIIGVKVYPNNRVLGATYDEEVQALHRFIVKRLAWLDTNLPGACS